MYCTKKDAREFISANEFKSLYLQVFSRMTKMLGHWN